MAIHSFLLVFVSLLRWATCEPQAALTGVTGTVDFLATAAPELAGPESTAGAACGGCYVVADVAALVWYSQAFVNTATAMVSVGAGNGTRGTRTSIVSPEGQFTFSPEAGSPGGAVLSAVPYQPTINVNGAILTSPTAYNVFTAYSVTSAVLSGGVCSTVSGPRMLLPQAYTEVVPQANGRVVLDQNGEQQFIKQLGFSSCSGGGVSIVPTALVPVSSTTMTTTQSFSSNVPLAAMTVGTAPSSTAKATTSRASAKAPLIVIGNQTLTPTAHPVNLPTLKLNGTSVAIASTGIVSVHPTGKGNFSQPTILPFINNAPSWRQVDAALSVAWVLGMFGFGIGVYYF